MRSSFVALAILAVVGSTVAAPTPGGSSYIPYTSGGNGGNGGSAVSGNGGTANGGSVYATGSGWGSTFVGSGEFLPITARYPLAHRHCLQLRAVTAVPPSPDPRREVMAATAAAASSVLVEMAETAAAPSPATPATLTVVPSTPRAVTSSLALVSIFPVVTPWAYMLTTRHS